MAGKTWQPGNAKKFAKNAELGKPYYYVNTHARNLGGYEDTHTYSEIVFDYRRPFTGTPASGSMDAVQLCQNFGPVYDSPPKGLRNLDGPPRRSPDRSLPDTRESSTRTNSEAWKS